VRLKKSRTSNVHDFNYHFGRIRHVFGGGLMFSRSCLARFNNDEMRLCVSITILMVFEMLFIAKSKACSKCSCLAKNFEFVASYTKIALVSSEYTENTTGLMKCAWVVKAQNSSHSVTFKMSQVLTTKSSFCGEDYVFIRD
ncbi:Hypothetical predicted protein, partial [Mytilus galloprovincialis]